VLALTLTVICTLIALLLAGPSQPTYKGRNLAHWVHGIATGNLSVEKVKALQAMGTNATPILLDWMRYESPPWKATAFKVTNRVLSLLHKEPLDDRQKSLADEATEAIWILQEQAPTLWADCTNIMLDTTISTNVQQRAYGLLFKHAWGDPILMPDIKEQLEATNAPSQ